MQKATNVINENFLLSYMYCILTEHVLQVTVEGLDAHASAVC